MAGEVRAVIDVGTNSVKLLVASVDGTKVIPLDERSEQTRLGQGFYESHLLQPSAIQQTAIAVAEFAVMARVWNPAMIRVIATSAARDAINKDELLSSIQREASLPVDIISGSEEADWAFLGVATDPALADANLLVMDIGGGSTEFTAGGRGHRIFGGSFKIGTVRYLERAGISDPPNLTEQVACADATRNFLSSEVKPSLASALEQLGPGTRLVGTGGTSAIVARIKLQSFNRETLDGAVLSHAEIRAQKELLWGMELEDRRKVKGLPADRADVILPGVILLDEAMGVFGFEELRISLRGLRFAALMQN